MRGRLDNVVMRHTSKMNSAGVSEVNLLIGHRHHCCCFMQPTDIDEFLEANGNFERVKAQIDRLRQSSFTGEFLFEFASKLVASSTMRSGLIAAVDKIAEEHVFSESSIKEYLATHCHKQSDESLFTHLKTSPAKSAFRYEVQGVPHESCGDSRLQAIVLLGSRIRTATLGFKKGLPLLAHEIPIFGIGSATVAHEVIVENMYPVSPSEHISRILHWKHVSWLSFCVSFLSRRKSAF